MQLSSKPIPGGLEFEVLASAGSSKSRVMGLHGTALKVAVRAAPEKGKANAEIEEVLAEWLGIPARQVQIMAGAASRKKRVRVLGISTQHLLDLLG